MVQKNTVDKSKLQLVGVTAMLIASKYEEMYAPEVGDFVFITDNTYSSEEIRKMERHMLRTLDYSLGTPLCLHFLRRYSRAGEVIIMRELELKDSSHLPIILLLGLSFRMFPKRVQTFFKWSNN